VLLADATGLKAPLIEKLARVAALAAEEKAYLGDLQNDFLRLRAGQDVITAGHAYRGIFILNRGLAIRYKVLHDGRRQLLSMVLPGEFIGFPGGLFEKARYSVSALTDAVACAVPFAAIHDLFRQHPRLGAAFFWLAGHDAALFAEHLVGLGRQTAYERMAHFLLELLVRLRAVGLADERSYEMPLTQELMADMLGLSVPHVNRTLRRLREEGLISTADTRITCHDVAALARVADFDRANLERLPLPGPEPARAPEPAC
jgi:CRP-like cAMP-binding protein